LDSFLQNRCIIEVSNLKLKKVATKLLRWPWWHCDFCKLIIGIFQSNTENETQNIAMIYVNDGLWIRRIMMWLRISN